MGLLSEIESIATDSAIPIVDLLRKCKVLAARLKHKEFADWVNSELSGYNETETLPSYRCLPTPSPIGHFSGPFGSGLNNVPIPISLLPEVVQKHVSEARMSQPIAELENLAKSKNGTLECAWSGDVIAIAQQTRIYQNMVLMAASSKISSAMLLGIIDTVRTKVLDYVLAIQATNPQADEATPSGPAPISPATLHQTFNTTIIGQGNVGGQGPQSISGNNTTNIAISQLNETLGPEAFKLFERLSKAGEKLEGPSKNEANYALEKVKTEIQSKAPDLTRIKNYLDIAGKLVALAPVAEKLYNHIAKLFA